MERLGKKMIAGIQQIGVGVEDLIEAWKWYYKAFGLDIKAFDDESVADLMAQYMGGQPRKKRAILAINLQGGGGFEIWQHKGRQPKKPDFEIKIGDIGIFAAKIKCKNSKQTYNYYKSIGIETINGLAIDPQGKENFYIKDPFGNYFHMVESNNWYKEEKKNTGGTYGAVIGVSDIDKARILYSDILGYNSVKYDKTDVFEDLKNISGGDKKMRRVLLAHEEPRQGSFSKLFGESEIELVQILDGKPQKIFKDRFWGDPGFIHLCYDIIGMDYLKKECDEKGFSFTVDSRSKHCDDRSFDMGDASGYFSYIEDPDGTLIEFVETHKLPIIKKFGWYMNLQKRNGKSLPKWMINTLRFSRVKKFV